MREAGVLAAAYLLGSLPFSYWMVRWARGIDVRTVGSGNAGATNVLRAAGRAPAVVALFLDAGKGAAAVGLCRAAGASPTVTGAAALLVVVGHCFPLFLGFRGGKGVATAAGALGMLVPRVFLLCMVVFVVVVAISRYVSLGSILAACAFPAGLAAAGALGWVDRGQWSLLPWTVALAALIVWKHRSNISRLLAGEENRLGERRSS